MDPSVVTHAQRGLEASWATPWKFWATREHRTEGAEQALDQVALHPEARTAVELTRAAAEQAPERKLELYRVGLEALSQQTTTAASGPMAGLALKLLDETKLEGQSRLHAAEKLYEKTPTSLAIKTLLQETPAPERLELVHECASLEQIALKLPDPKPLELAQQSEVFQKLPDNAPRNELARCFLTDSQSWMADYLREHPEEVDLAVWTIEQAPPSAWKQHDDPRAVAMHIHQPYDVDSVLEAALDARAPEKWLPELQKLAAHRPQEGALQLASHLEPEQLKAAFELIADGANAARLAGKFPELSGIVPREGFLRLITDQPAEIQARALKAVGEQPDNLAAIAYRTAGAANNLGDKFALAQLGLMELDKNAGNKPATRMLWNMTRLHTKTPHPQAAWLRTAMALEALAVASQGPLPESPQGLLDLGLRMVDASFMVPSWFAAAATTVIETLQENATNPLEQQVLEQHRQKLTGRIQPEQARKVLTELRALLDSQPYRLSQGQRQAGIAEKKDAVIVGGVKVTRKGRDRNAATGASGASARPEWPELKPDRLKSDRKSETEVRQAASGTIQGVYNPNTGETEWKTSPNQLAGAYNPRTGEVEWQEARTGGIAALYSPNQGKVLYKTSNGAIQGLFNRASRRERFEAVYTGRRAGAFRPLDGRERWESCSSGYNSGVYCPEREDFRFETSYSSAIAAVSNDPSAATLASNGTGPLTPGTGTSHAGPS